jgi:hypothetical protein
MSASVADFGDVDCHMFDLLEQKTFLDKHKLSEKTKDKEKRAGESVSTRSSQRDFTIADQPLPLRKSPKLKTIHCRLTSQSVSAKLILS